jgi:hypothetical protein
MENDIESGRLNNQQQESRKWVALARQKYWKIKSSV